ncbi:hypothetical protein C8Q77DRAFT_227298 [Trametes polyzona]|nr:hypothetical protein C8Q77DRAFT_227298 [Trametes polyzona]
MFLPQCQHSVCRRTGPERKRGRLSTVVQATGTPLKGDGLRRFLRATSGAGSVKQHALLTISQTRLLAPVASNCDMRVTHLPVVNASGLYDEDKETMALILVWPTGANSPTSSQFRTTIHANSGPVSSNNRPNASQLRFAGVRLYLFLLIPHVSTNGTKVGSVIRLASTTSTPHSTIWPYI